MTAEKQTASKRRVGDGTPGPGRKKGVPNKTTTLLKEMILGALADAGGQAYLARQAIENPGPFMTLVGKVLPLQVSGEGGGPVQVETINRDAEEFSSRVAMLAARASGEGDEEPEPRGSGGA